jgi:ADP-heptose:LPS heptosyltransferase
MLRSLELLFKRALLGLLRLLFRSPRPADPFHPSPRAILVIRQHNQLGDMLCVVPLLRALRESYPSARISLMTSPVNDAVMRDNRYLTDTILYDKSEFLRRGLIRPAPLIRFVRGLRQRRFDLALVPSTVSTSFTSDLLARLSGARVRIGAASLDGNENPSAFFFNAPVELDWRRDEHRHQTLRNMDLVTGGGIRTRDLSLEITLSQEELNEGEKVAREARGEGRYLIGIHPGAGKPPNRWPAESFSRLANGLHREMGSSILVTSGPMDEEQLALVLGQLAMRADILRNRPIRTVAAVLKHLDLYITNDTGLMHVAAGMGTPVLSLFGPTDPHQWAPMAPNCCYMVGDGGVIENITLESVHLKAISMLGRRR